MKKKILYAICGILLVIMLSAAALFVWAVYDELAEKPPVWENLLEEDVELDVRGDDIQALVGETDALLRVGSWQDGRGAGTKQQGNNGI